MRLTLYESEDLLVLLLGLALLHQVDLVLQDEDVLQLHDLYGCQMLRRLGLRTRLVTRWRRGTRSRVRELITRNFSQGFCLVLEAAGGSPISRRAASMTAAPFNMVAIKMS